MAILQHQAACTVHNGEGGTCGVEDQCTTVRTLRADGQILHQHDVCRRHRTEMGLPEWDVDLTVDGEQRQV